VIYQRTESRIPLDAAVELVHKEVSALPRRLPTKGMLRSKLAQRNRILCAKVLQDEVPVKAAESLVPTVECVQWPSEAGVDDGQRTWNGASQSDRVAVTARSGVIG
jgi:hypothetical protein